jgi:hypothetical protein
MPCSRANVGISPESAEVPFLFLGICEGNLILTNNACSGSHMLR